MSLRDEIAASYQRIALDVRIAGSPVPRVVGVDTSSGFSQVNSQATVHLLERPSSAIEGASCEVWVLINGLACQIFGGEIVGPQWSYFPGAVALDCRDLLARARLEWGGDERTYAIVDDADVIFNLLNAMAIPEERMHIESSGWTLGTVQEVTAPSGRAFWPLIEEIDHVSGFKTYGLPDGTIWRKRISPVAGPTASFTYEQGVNLIDIRRRRGRDGIVNRVIFTGLNYEGVIIGGPGVAEAQAPNAFVPNPPGHITRREQSDLVEDDPKALEIAERMLADENRRPESYEATVMGNPLLQPGMTVQLIADEVESGDATVLIDRVQHSFRGASYRTTFATFGGNLSGVVVENLPPAITLNVVLDQEVEDTGSAILRRIVVVADAGATTDPDGDETLITFDWALSVDVGTIDPTTASGVGLSLVRALIDGDATVLTIELTATDEGGAISTVTRTVPIDSSTVLIEPVYSAEGEMIAATDDGGQNWGEYTLLGGAESHCTMPIGPAWGNVFGADDGHIYATFDYLATDPVDLGAPHGAIEVTAVWVHETDTTRLWAGYDDGAVYFATVDPVAQTAAWELRGTAPAGPIQEIRESIGALGSLRITAGNGYYESEDGGATWSTTHDFESQAWRMAGGWESNLASALDNDDPIFAETGTAPTLPVLDPVVRDIGGISFGWRLPELYLASGSRLLRADDLVTATHIDDAPAEVLHLIRSGNVDGVVYGALKGDTGDGGIMKSIRLESPWYLRQTGARTVHMVGYGPAHQIAGAYELILIPQGASGADDKIRRSSAGLWHELDPPMPSWYWGGVAVNPFNQSEWLLWGTDNANHWSHRNSGNTLTHGDGFSGSTSPLWHTDDAGATWTEIALTQDGGVYGGSPASDPMFAVWGYAAWDETTSGRWALIMQTNAFGDDGWLWVGNGTTAADALFYDNVVTALIASAPGGEWITTKFNGPTRPLCRISNTGVLSTLDEGTTIPGGDAFVWHAAPELLQGSRTIVGLRENTANGWGVQDYLSGLVDAHFAVSGNPAWITAATHGVYVATDGAIVRVDDPLGTYSATTVAGSGTAFAYIRAGRRFRRAVAALTSDKTTIYATGNGTTWQLLTLPAAWDKTKISPMVEVIERGI